MEALLDEGFVIDNDTKAEWALRKIRERNAERDRIVETARQCAAEYEAVAREEERKAAKDNEYMEALLRRYFDIVEHGATKTQETYRLPTGRLKYKLPSQKMVPDTEALIESYPSYVKQEPKLQWGELKKRFTITDNYVLDTETGELVTGVDIEDVPGAFSVEV